MAETTTYSNYKNHIYFLTDESSSMLDNNKSKELVKVVNAEIADLAKSSVELKQETRVSIYTFADKVKNLIDDMDVMRLPDFESLYQPYGWTALLDGVHTVLDDMELISQKYGDHAFLLFALTDGFENASKIATTQSISKRLAALKDNQTVAILVPDQKGVFKAKQYGFPANNIAVWNPDSKGGVAEVGSTIRQTTSNFMVARSRGVRGSKDLFSMTSDNLNKATVTANLIPLKSNEYMLVPVPGPDRVYIKEFFENNGLPFRLGAGFYQLTERVKVQPQKQVIVLEKKTGKVYSGPQARELLKLPDFETRISPQDNKEFDVFIQSTAPNRYLLPHTKLLILK